MSALQSQVLAVAALAGLFRADIFASPSARRAVAALAREGLLISYGGQFRISQAGHALTVGALDGGLVYEARTRVRKHKGKP